MFCRVCRKCQVQQAVINSHYRRRDLVTLNAIKLELCALDCGTVYSLCACGTAVLLAGFTGHSAARPTDRPTDRHQTRSSGQRRTTHLAKVVKRIRNLSTHTCYCTSTGHSFTRVLPSYNDVFATNFIIYFNQISK